MANYRVGGEHQKICCDCCKEGIIHGQNGDECTYSATNDTVCKKSFEKCCNSVVKTGDFFTLFSYYLYEQ